MNSNTINQDAEDRMRKSIEALKVELAKIRTGRAHTGILDHITVMHYGALTPLNQVANITLIDARTIGISPWDKKTISAIEKAIRESDLGLNPASSSDIIRVPMPILTEERRKELTKVVRNTVEMARVSIRNIRRDANNALKNLLKEKLISEDDEHRAQEHTQQLTNKFIAELDKMQTAKETDLMTV